MSDLRSRHRRETARDTFP